jgi:hypothetical protein
VADSGKTKAVARRSPSDGKDVVVFGSFATASAATSFSRDVLRTEKQRVRQLVGSGEG